MKKKGTTKRERRLLDKFKPVISRTYHDLHQKGSLSRQIKKALRRKKT